MEITSAETQVLLPTSPEAPPCYISGKALATEHQVYTEQLLSVVIFDLHLHPILPTASSASPGLLSPGE